MPDTEGERRYTEREYELILRRAIELDAPSALVPQPTPEPTLPPEGLTLSKIKEIAAEVGVDPARVAEAASTLGIPERSVPARVSTAAITAEEAKLLTARLNRSRGVQLLGLGIVIVAAIPALVSRVAAIPILGLRFSFWGPLAAALLLAKLVLLFATYGPRYCPECGMSFDDPGEH